MSISDGSVFQRRSFCDALHCMELGWAGNMGYYRSNPPDDLRERLCVVIPAIVSIHHLSFRHGGKRGRAEWLLPNWYALPHPRFCPSEGKGTLRALWVSSHRLRSILRVRSSTGRKDAYVRLAHVDRKKKLTYGDELGVFGSSLLYGEPAC